MTKPATPPARNEVVEIDAMDVAEWESGQSTPQASDANLAELVRKTAAPPEAPSRVQTVARERSLTQLGPVIPRPASRARTEPPGPPPKPARARTSDGGPSAPPARATRVPDISAGPPVEPRRSPAPMTGGGIDFSLPVTATSPGMPAAPEPRRPLTQTPVGGVDFSLPVTATSPGMPAAPAAPEPRRPLTQTPIGGVDFSPPVAATSPGMAEPAAMRFLPAPPGETGFSRPAIESRPTPPSEPRSRPAGSGTDVAPAATATSDSGARPPEPELLPPTPSALPLAGPPRVDPGPGASPFAERSRVGPGPGTSPFAERSRVGPGHNASPAGGGDPNTAWPPRPIPVDPSPEPVRSTSAGRQTPSAQLPRLAAPAPAPRSQAPGPDDAGRPDRRKVALSHHRRLWWIGGGIASASVAAILVALALPGPEAPPPEASDAAGAPAVQATGPRRGVRPEQPADRAAADLRERVRLARDAAAAGVPMAPPAPPPVEHRPTRLASPADLSAWLRSDEPESGAAPRHARKKPAHRLVVDYSARPSEPAPPSLVVQSAEDPAIGMARNAYTTGNQQLFVGDLDGAVRAYREALEIYPGYVGGYRGLGLAYEQLGDKANALAALRVYVAAVPNARDIALVKKRIIHLQRR